MRILISGASGLLGSALIHNAPDFWQITGWVHTHKSNPDIYAEAVNLLMEKEIIKAFDACAPQLVIHTAAIANANLCTDNPELSEKINFRASKCLAHLCAEKNIPLVFTSTDLVFDGMKGNYTESDDPNPLSQYAEDKLMAEETIAQIIPSALICRLPLLIGYSPYQQSGYLENFLLNHRAKKNQVLFTDEFRSPSGVHSTAKSIIQIAGKHSGLLHLGGTEKMSRWQLGQMLIESLNLQQCEISNASINDYQGKTLRAKDVSLNSEKANLLGIKTVSLRDELLSLRT